MIRRFVLATLFGLALMLTANVASAQQGVPGGEFFDTVNGVDASWRSAQCGTSETVAVYDNVRESRNGQGTRISFIVQGGPCDGVELGRTNGNANNGPNSGNAVDSVFVANGNVYAVGTDFRGNDAIWTPKRFKGPGEGIWGVTKSVATSGPSDPEACVSADGFSAQLGREGRRGQGQRILFYQGEDCPPGRRDMIGRTNGAGNNAAGYHSTDENDNDSGVNTNPDAFRAFFVVDGIPYALIEAHQSKKGPLMLVAPRSLYRPDAVNRGIRNVDIVARNIAD